MAQQANREVSKAKREFREQARPLCRPNCPPRPRNPSLSSLKGPRSDSRIYVSRQLVRRILKNGPVEVDVGFLKNASGPGRRIGSDGSGRHQQFAQECNVDTGPRWDISYREINLIGKRAEEALEEVDKFLDSAALASVDRVRIIHGHGMGVLKRAVTEYLSKSPLVSRHYRLLRPRAVPERRLQNCVNSRSYEMRAASSQRPNSTHVLHAVGSPCNCRSLWCRTSMPFTRNSTSSAIFVGVIGNAFQIPDYCQAD